MPSWNWSIVKRLGGAYDGVHQSRSGDTPAEQIPRWEDRTNIPEERSWMLGLINIICAFEPIEEKSSTNPLKIHIGAV